MTHLLLFTGILAQWQGKIWRSRNTVIGHPFTEMICQVKSPGKKKTSKRVGECWEISHVFLLISFQSPTTLTQQKLPLNELKNYNLIIWKKTTQEGVYAGFVGVSKNYVERYWKVEQCINNNCVQQKLWCSVKYTRGWVTHKGSFAAQNKTCINIPTIWVWIPALLISSINALRHSTTACNISDFQ